MRKKDADYLGKGLDGELPPVELAAFEKRLETDAGSRATVEQLRDLGEMAREAVPEAPDAGNAWGDFRTRLAERSIMEEHGRKSWMPFATAGGVLAACLAVMLVVRSMLPGDAVNGNGATIHIAEGPAIEFVELYYTDASPVVTTDPETGWTVVDAFEMNGSS